MTRIILVLGMTVIPVGAVGQTAAETIERALAAAPARAREEATVVKWKADYTYDVLKDGTNGLVCYDRSDEPRRPPFAVQCTSMGNLARVAQNRRFRAESADADEERAMVAAAEESGTRVLPEYGSLWIQMNGRDRASARTHTTVAVPGATTESTGLPETRSASVAYIMAAGTSGAHLMIPGN